MFVLTAAAGGRRPLSAHYFLGKKSFCWMDGWMDGWMGVEPKKLQSHRLKASVIGEKRAVRPVNCITGC